MTKQMSIPSAKHCRSAASSTLMQTDGLEEQGLGKISKLPLSIKVLLEARCTSIRRTRNYERTCEAARNLGGGREDKEIPFIPARIVLQDFTGVPVVVDLAAMRETVKKAGGDPKQINPLVPVDLVIDHSVMVDAFGTPEALEYNMDIEFKRNGERYRFFVGHKQHSIISVLYHRHRYRSPSQPGVPGIRCRY